MAHVACKKCSHSFNATNENHAKCPKCGHEFGFNAEMENDRDFMHRLASLDLSDPKDTQLSNTTNTSITSKVKALLEP